MHTEAAARDRITLRFLAAPGDAAGDGVTVQAGSVLEWIDKAGYACAVGWASTSCVTAYVGNVNFEHPIAVGSLVETTATVIYTRRTSIHVSVRVDAADPKTGEYVTAAHCILIFVSVDDAGKPTPVEAWMPGSPEQRDLASAAEARVAARAEIHEAMKRQTYSEEGTAPRVTLRFLAAPSAVNFGGNAHGGTVMRWIDDAARTCAMMWGKRDAVAVYSGGIHFYSPVHIGDLVEVEARLIHTGPHSMHVAVHVRSGDPAQGERRLTTQCMSVLVCVGADGTALPIAPFIPVTAEDNALDAHAVELVEMRAALLSLSYM